MSLWYRNTGRVIFTGVSQYGKQRSQEFPTLNIHPDGIEGDGHYGRMRRLSTPPRSPIARHLGYPNDARCENDRQFSAVSLEEVCRIIAEMELLPKGEAPSLDFVQRVAECMAANLVIEGVEHFSKLPSGTMLTFENPLNEATPRAGVILEVSSFNSPCGIPHRNIVDMMAELQPEWKPTVWFQEAAAAWRGVVGRVKMDGVITAATLLKCGCRATPRWRSSQSPTGDSSRLKFERPYPRGARDPFGGFVFLVMVYSFYELLDNCADRNGS